MKRPLKSVFFFLLIIPVFFSCSNNPPEIFQTWWLPVLGVNADGAGHLSSLGEELILFAHIGDGQGRENLGEIRLLFDGDELFWKMNESEWTEQNFPGEFWAGSGRIIPLNGHFPPGEYTLEVEDKGGRIGRQILYLEGWPSEDVLKGENLAALAAGEWFISSSREWFILSNGKTVPCPVGKTFSPASLLEAGESDFYFFTMNREENWGLRAGPYSFLSAE